MLITIIDITRARRSARPRTAGGSCGGRLESGLALASGPRMGRPPVLSPTHCSVRAFPADVAAGERLQRQARLPADLGRAIVEQLHEPIDARERLLPRPVSDDLR